MRGGGGMKLKNVKQDHAKVVLSRFLPPFVQFAADSCPLLVEISFGEHI